jgi:hypothetical protein
MWPTSIPKHETNHGYWSAWVQRSLSADSF